MAKLSEIKWKNPRDWNPIMWIYRHVYLELDFDVWFGILESNLTF